MRVRTPSGDPGELAGAGSRGGPEQGWGPVSQGGFVSQPRPNRQGQLVWLVMRAFCWPSGPRSEPQPEEPQPSSGTTHHPAGSRKHTAAVLLTRSHFHRRPCLCLPGKAQGTYLTRALSGPAPCPATWVSPGGGQVRRTVDRPHGAQKDPPEVTLTLSCWLVPVGEYNEFVVRCRKGLGVAA